MTKLKYKDYDGIAYSECDIHTETIFKGKLIKVYFIKDINTFNKLLNSIGLHFWVYKVYFWCPYKSILSIANYGTIGKKSRGKYSNLWFELGETNVTDLERSVMNYKSRFNMYNWVRKSKLYKVTNKELKAYLEEYIPKLTQ